MPTPQAPPHLQTLIEAVQRALTELVGDGVVSTMDFKTYSKKWNAAFPGQASSGLIDEEKIGHIIGTMLFLRDTFGLSIATTKSNEDSPEPPIETSTANHKASLPVSLRELGGIIVEEFRCYGGDVNHNTIQAFASLWSAIFPGRTFDDEATARESQVVAVAFVCVYDTGETFDHTKFGKPAVEVREPPQSDNDGGATKPKYAVTVECLEPPLISACAPWLIHGKYSEVPPSSICSISLVNAARWIVGASDGAYTQEKSSLRNPWFCNTKFWGGKKYTRVSPPKKTILGPPHGNVFYHEWSMLFPDRVLLIDLGAARSILMDGEDFDPTTFSRPKVLPNADSGGGAASKSLKSKKM